MRHHSFLGAVLFLLSKTICVVAARYSTMVYYRGDFVAVQCLHNGQWQAPPKCEETSEPIAIRFGIDTMLDCHVAVKDVSIVKPKLLQGKQQPFFQCRVAASKDQNAWIPLAVPIVGTVPSPSASEFTVQTKYSIVFHSSLHAAANTGTIVGGSIYPMMDANFLQFARRGTRLSLHGTVRWFQRSSFIGISSRSRDSAFISSNNSSAYSTYSFFGWMLLVFLLTTLCATMMYAFKLKPDLRRKYLKGL